MPPSFPFDNIADRGFEQVSVGTGISGYLYDPTGSPWSFTAQTGIEGDIGSGIAANGSSFTYLNAPAPEGTQVAFLQDYGSFSQSVAFDWTAGSYQITFKAAQRVPQPIYSIQPYQQDFNVLIDGSPVGTFTPSGTSYQTYTTAPFTISTPGPHMITFQGLDTAGGDNTALIDQVVLVEVAGQPPIADQGFEQVSVGAGGYQYDPTGSAWTFSPEIDTSGSGIAANNSGFTAGQPAGALEGVQVAFLQQTGSFSQSVAGWAPGSYQITFRAAQRDTGQTTRQDFDVLVDGVVIGVFSPDSLSYQGYTTVAFTIADPGPHTITFQGLDSGGGDNTAFIDQVVASPVAAGPPLVPDAHGFEAGSRWGLARTRTHRPTLHGPSPLRSASTARESRKTTADSPIVIHLRRRACRSPSSRGPAGSANRSPTGPPELTRLTSPPPSGTGPSTSSRSNRTSKC